MTTPDERVKELELVFAHTHVAKYDGDKLLDECAKCGLDLRDVVHSGKGRK